MYNNVLLVGRAVDKPTIRTIESGASVGNLTIAVNRPFKSLEGKQEVDFINCVMWGPIATNSADYINKGSYVILVIKSLLLKLISLMMVWLFYF